MPSRFPTGQKQPVKGVANYGLRPTVEQTTRPLLEVHLLESSSLTYGDKLLVQWLHFLRPESKFGSLEELRRQIETDRKSALNFFQKMSPPESFQRTLDTPDPESTLRPLSRLTGW